jgi:preprotein translocase subunit YajC
MRKTRFASLLSICSALALMTPLAPVAAQAAITAGMAVKDTSGGDVGTVTSVNDGIVVVKTDRHEVGLPASSFTPSEGQLLFAMTQAQLNAEVDKANAAAQAQITVGASVRGSAGAVVGTIDAIEDEFITLKLTSGELVKLPKQGVGSSPDGPVIGMTADELKAAVTASSS